MLEGMLLWSFPQGSPFWKPHTLFCNGLAEKTATSCSGFSNEAHQQYLLISAWARRRTSCSKSTAANHYSVYFRWVCL